MAYKYKTIDDAAVNDERQRRAEARQAKPKPSAEEIQARLVQLEHEHLSNTLALEDEEAAEAPNPARVAELRNNISEIEKAIKALPKA